MPGMFIFSSASRTSSTRFGRTMLLISFITVLLRTPLRRPVQPIGSFGALLLSRAPHRPGHNRHSTGGLPSFHGLERFAPSVDAVGRTALAHPSHSPARLPLP